MQHCPSALEAAHHTLSNSDQRLSRHLREYKRLRRAFLALALGHPAVKTAQEDQRALKVFAEHGFQPYDLCPLRLEIGGAVVVAIAVPGRIWFRPGKMSRVLEAKRVARASGLACLLVPEGAVRQQPRLANCEAIARSAGTPVDTRSVDAG